MNPWNKITPGVIDEHAEYAFLYGACGGLAVALHDATGWPITAVTVDGEEWHYIVQAPAGRYVDVLGIQDEDDVRLRYEVDGTVELIRANRGQVWADYRDDGRVPMSVVRSIARAVLARIPEVSDGGAVRDALVWPDFAPDDGRCGASLARADGLLAAERARVLADAADYLAGMGMADAAYMLRTTDVPYRDVTSPASPQARIAA